jgi:hypothetical protein
MQDAGHSPLLPSMQGALSFDPAARAGIACYAKGTAYRTTSQKQQALPPSTKRCHSACAPNQRGKGSGRSSRKIAAPTV